MKNKFILLSYLVILLLLIIVFSQKAFVSIGVSILALVALYIFSIIIKLGLHQRLPLALGNISIQNIPDRAAKKYGNQILFTADKPCSWDIPALQNEYPDKSAWSAVQLKSIAAYLAKMFKDFFKLKAGERIAILKQNHFDIHLFMTAVVRAGCVACPINGKFESINIEPYLSNIGSKLLITDYATLDRLLKECNNLGCIVKILLAEKREVSPDSEINKSIISFNLKFPQITIYWIEETLNKIDQEADAIPRSKEDVLYLVHSSGTTGFPKAVILQNGPQSYAIRGWLCYVHVSRKRDKAYLAVPNNHQAVILSFNSMLLLGLRVHWTSSYDSENFNSDKILRELYEGNYTGFFGFPIAYTQLKDRLEHSKHLRKIRFWASTADASHEAIIKPFVKSGNAFKSLGIPVDGSIFLDAQGSSEVGTPSVLRYYTPLTRKYARRIGKPGSTPFGPKIRITKLNGEPAKVEEPGRLEVKGKTVFRSYWNNPELTQKSFTNGWFFTGDIVRMNKKKSIIQLDREVDVIHSATGDIFSLPIEEKIHHHPAVFDVCVYGALGENRHQLVYAAIALKAGFVYSECELLRELNQLLSSTEQLHRCDIIRWDEFPFGVTGKTLKRVFRERSKKLLFTDTKSAVGFYKIQKNKMKNIFITGATGFLGSYFLYHVLQHSEDKIICLARNNEKSPAKDRIIQQLYSIHSSYSTIGIGETDLDEKIKRRLEVIAGDITLENLGLHQNFGKGFIQECWHFAANVKFSESRKEEVTSVNLEGCRNVLKFIKQNGLTVLNYVSTAYVAGQKTGSVGEMSDLNLYPANNVYEESKRTMEKEIKVAHENGEFNYRIFRPGIIVGHSQICEPDPSNGGLYGFLYLSLMLKRNIATRYPNYFKENTVKILADVNPKLSLITVDHVVDQLFQIGNDDDSLNKTYHLTPNEETDGLAIASIINRLSGLNFEFVTNTNSFQQIDYLFDNKINRYQCYLLYNKHFENTNSAAGLCTGNQEYQIDSKILYRLIKKFYEKFKKINSFNEECIRV